MAQFESLVYLNSEALTSFTHPFLFGNFPLLASTGSLPLLRSLFLLWWLLYIPTPLSLTFYPLFSKMSDSPPRGLSGTCWSVCFADGMLFPFNLVVHALKHSMYPPAHTHCHLSHIPPCHSFLVVPYLGDPHGHLRLHPFSALQSFKCFKWWLPVSTSLLEVFCICH